MSHLIQRPSSLRTPTLSRTSLSLGVSTALLMPVAAQAQADAQAAAQEATLKPVVVSERAVDHNPHSEAGAPYKARTSGDERRVKPLAETAATISVLTQQQLQDTGRSDLRDILRAQPGITLGTGENGNAFGDRYIIRGQEARSDVFVDGLRDPGMTVRESFATEQVEITKGPSATFAGRGAVGGAVNSVTKQATTVADFTKVSVGVGTDEHRRLSLDANHVLNDRAAVRVNLLEAYEEVPGRDPSDRARKGLAASLNLKPTSQLSITTDYYHLEANDRPDLGAWVGRDNKILKGTKNYSQDEDFLTSKIDTFTVRVGYQANEQVKVTNLTRYGTTENGYIATSAALPGLSTNTTYPTIQPNAARLSSHNGWQDVEYFANQTNVLVDQTIAGMKHQFVFGLEYSDHKVTNGRYSITNTGTPDFIQQSQTGSNPVQNTNVFLAFDANGNALHNQLKRSFSKGNFTSDWHARTLSGTAMDTIDVTDALSVSGGIRYDRVQYSNFVVADNQRYTLNSGLWNAHLGTTYKLSPEGNVYALISTASDFNGGESDVTNCNYGGLCLVGSTPAQKQANYQNSSPEKTTSFELGTKWNLFDNKLLATASAFHTVKKDVMESLNATGYTTTGTLNTAEYKIHGVEFGLAGNVTDKLSVQGGFALMNSRVLKSYTASNVGKGLSNFPEDSLSLLASYKFTPKFSFGGNLTYHGKQYNGGVEAAQGSIEVPAYAVVDLFASYKFNRNLSARVNIGNVFNKEYFLSVYNNAGKFAYLGDARNARVTVKYDF